MLLNSGTQSYQESHESTWEYVGTVLATVERYLARVLGWKPQSDHCYIYVTDRNEA